MRGSAVTEPLFVPQELLCPMREWISRSYHLFRPNGPGRYFGTLQRLYGVPLAAWKIRDMVEHHYGIVGARVEPEYQHFCNYQTEGAKVQRHRDSPDRHIRFNVMVSKPEKGGEPVVDGKVLEVVEGESWICRAGMVAHSSTAVVGPKPRMILSFGYILDYPER